MKSHERDVVVSALKHAAPYIRLYKKKIFVLKAGGESPCAGSGADQERRALGRVRVVVAHTLNPMPPGGMPA